MFSLHPTQQLIAASPPLGAVRTTASPPQRLKWWPLQWRICPHMLNARPHEYNQLQNTRSSVSCTINMTAGQSDGPKKMNLDQAIEKARKIWGSFPEPVRRFPWITALENFIQFNLDLVYAVAKYLSIPLLAVSTLSEMSYCAHERKMRLIPIPILAGIAVAGVLRDTALEISPSLKGAEYPWHLLAIAIFFTLLKLPGPYYPYWGRVLIPHFANGGLFSVLWFAFLWYRRSQGEETSQETSPDGTHSEEKKL
ncbi:uncharacterized protein LOC122072083 [Macadamia integrifolia]|uniref:uncharacterized protein LOC122072083 n=1 Tax=Macadamia integrifolia TaxID=60698 RepID=UPI001C4F4F9D|nr:uncharacterized protein LOC122072083 [Macadamia integrifolia]XP_042492558.1 uncharacterized protein LOC122072083 [Macadamia integrifolia]XP_042492559.1 uncharacterized protein LOC122072083 [Macadamia integrifolia]